MYISFFVEIYKFIILQLYDGRLGRIKIEFENHMVL